MSSDPNFNLYEILRTNAERHGHRPALLAPGRRDLNHQELFDFVNGVHASLDALGVRHGDRIAVAIENGPEAATLFLSLGTYGTFAPLNPQYTKSEMENYLSDLAVDWVVADQKPGAAIVGAADHLGIPTLLIEFELSKPAGIFGLKSQKGTRKKDQPLRDRDVALILHTSGTLSKPKKVPLSQKNICAAARNTARALRLDSSDRSLNILPLFHVHGLIGAVLSPLVVGGSAVCTPGYYAGQFFGWVAECKPTWYTAVPTIHQSVLARAESFPEESRFAKFRFIRSASASLPVVVLERLEKTFHVPVIETYGMTEAAPQIACNPMPPAKRKPGSVGVAAGPEVAILDSQGVPQTKSGVTGEIVIRGENVFAGYEDNSKANADAFVGGWLKTGDIGHFDNEGYLFITGREKEIINRAGEKISPTEVESLLLTHPAVLEACVFSVPDQTVGEEVGAAIVVRPGQTLDVRSLKNFIAANLSEFKVPRIVKVVNELPKSATGKLKRLQMAAALGIDSVSARSEGGPHQRVEPSTETEKLLARLWSEILNVPSPGVTDNFFDLGGDSMSALQLTGEIQSVSGAEISPRDFFEWQTISEMAKFVEELSRGTAKESPKAVAREQHIPVSFSQQWHLRANEITPGAFNNVYCPVFQGALDFAALESSLQRVIARNEVLRTYFPVVNGQREQKILNDHRLVIEKRDFSALSENVRETEIRKFITDFSIEKFNFEAEVPLKAALLLLNENEHMLVLSYSHTLLDRWSMNILLHELLDGYCALKTGQPSLLPVEVSQFADFSNSQRSYFTGELLDERLRYWEETLRGVDSKMSIAKSSAEASSGPIEVANHGFSMAPDLAQALKNFSVANRVSVYMTLLTSFKTLLSRYLGTGDVLIANVTSAGRSKPEYDRVIGPCSGLMPLRTQFSSGEDFVSALARVRQSVLDADKNFLPPVFFERFGVKPRIIFNLLNVPPVRTCILPGIQNPVELPKNFITRLELPEVGLVLNSSDLKDRRDRRRMIDIDLNMALIEVRGELRGSIWYRKDLVFDRPSIPNLAAEFVNAVKLAVGAS